MKSLKVNEVNQYGQAYGNQKTEGVKQELDREAFLKILVAQLRNQDPLNPIDGENFIAQMAQLSALEQLTTLNQKVVELGSMQQETRALALLNKQVSVERPTGEILQGKVESVIMGPEPRLLINQEYFFLGALREVNNGGDLSE